MALGGKLIWQVYKDKNHPVSRIFRMKYLKGRSLRNITSANTSLGSGIWNSCRKCFDSFNLQLYRTPGNGKKIYLWEDRISRKPPSPLSLSLQGFEIGKKIKAYFALLIYAPGTVMVIGLVGHCRTSQLVSTLRNCCCFLLYQAKLLSIFLFWIAGVGVLMDRTLQLKDTKL